MSGKISNGECEGSINRDGEGIKNWQHIIISYIPGSIHRLFEKTINGNLG